MKNAFLLPAILASLFAPSACLSQQETGGGLTGEISAVVLLLGGADNLSPGSSKSNLSSLDASPGRTWKALPAVLPELIYNFGEENRFSWYLSTRSPMDEAGPFAVSSGAAFNRPGLARFQGGVFYVPFVEVWKNPYLINEARQETDVTSWGALFSASQILDTGLLLKIAYLGETVDDDDLATLYPQLGRSGGVYSLTAGYRLFNAGPFPLTPQLSLVKGQYDGESSSFLKIRAELSGRWVAGRLFLMPVIYSSYREHDEKDPVFASTRNEYGYGMNLLVKYGGLFGIPEVSVTGIAGIGRGEANESFYDTESMMCGVGLAYGF